ncbi:MAG: GNAT family N-acetyltransferase, partial [Actinomycetales bacterium]|nr:GNAT family N-acetyltransferase [Actinomycetales bacterium]
MDEVGELLGYVKPGPTRDDDADGPGLGEIYALYVHPDRWSRGAGHALMSAAIERLDPASPVALWRCGAVGPHRERSGPRLLRASGLPARRRSSPLQDREGEPARAALRPAPSAPSARWARWA